MRSLRFIVIGGLFVAVMMGWPLANAREKRIHPPSVSLTQENGWTAIKTDDGVLFIWNREGLHFTLSIKGSDIRPMNDPDHIFFVVDGLVFSNSVVAHQ